MIDGMMKPSISIVTATLNAARTLPECLASTLAQTAGLLEHIIVDGKSSDSTVAILQKFEALDPRVRYISEPDTGIYAALNKGFKMARGDWIYVIGADDELYGETVCAKVLEFVANMPCDVVFGDLIYGDSHRISYKDFHPIHLARYMPPHQGMFIRRGIFDKHGPFGSKYHLAEDYCFMLRLFSDSSVRWRYIPEPIAVYSISGRSSHLIDRKFYRDLPGLFFEYFGSHPRFSDRIRCSYMAHKPAWFRPHDWLINILHRPSDSMR